MSQVTGQFHTKTRDLNRKSQIIRVVKAHNIYSLHKLFQTDCKYNPLDNFSTSRFSENFDDSNPRAAAGVRRHDFDSVYWSYPKAKDAYSCDQ